MRCRNGEPLDLVLEITGMSKDKAAKKWTVENRWLPAVNRIRQQHGWDKWDFLEIANEADLADLRNILLQRLSQPPAFGIWRREPVDAIAYQKKLRSEWTRDPHETSQGPKGPQGRRRTPPPLQPSPSLASLKSLSTTQPPPKASSPTAATNKSRLSKALIVYDARYFSDRFIDRNPPPTTK